MTEVTPTGSVLPPGVTSLSISGLEARWRALLLTKDPVGYANLVADLFTALRALPEDDPTTDHEPTED